MLDRAQVHTFYDRFGAWQDAQRVYEDPAIDDLVAHGGFEGAQRVYELGCGTGRFAQRLLEGVLPPAARYVGVDLSSTMVRLARRRLARFGMRAEVRLAGGDPVVLAPDATLDRVVSLYVLDLLPEVDIDAFIADADRALVPGGRIALVSLTFGNTSLSRVVSGGWAWLQRYVPRLVGGCRPIEIAHKLPRPAWTIVHRQVVAAWGVPSEVVVAESRGAAPPTGAGLPLA